MFQQPTATILLLTLLASVDGFATTSTTLHLRAKTVLMAQSKPPTFALRGGSADSPRSERTYIMIKPDGVQRGLVGNIITRFETKGYKMTAMKTRMATSDLLQTHYADLISKPFFPKLEKYMLSGPVVCMVWEGTGAVKTGRKMLGSTNPLESEPGTIRGDYCLEVGRNICHGSDSVENAEKEIKIWFEEGVLSWASCQEDWVFE